jgi:hypothetical protein
MAERRLTIAVASLLILFSTLSTSLTAQDTTPRAESRNRLRIGISLGGTGFLGIVTEYQHGDWAGELGLGTISFRELSVFVTGKRYFAGGSFRPVLGAGFWNLSEWTEEGSGSVFIFRAPIGIDWQVSGGHALGAEVGLNRALAIDRRDTEDDTPPSPRLVPFPGIYYRYGWEH